MSNDFILQYIHHFWQPFLGLHRRHLQQGLKPFVLLIIQVQKARSADFPTVNFFSGSSFTRLTGFQSPSATNTGVLNLQQGYEAVQLNPKQFNSIGTSWTGVQSKATKWLENFRRRFAPLLNSISWRSSIEVQFNREGSNRVSTTEGGGGLNSIKSMI